MFPQLLRIGDSEILVLPSYGVLVAAGFLLGLLVARLLARRTGLAPERISDLAIWTLLLGLVGSKLALILLDLPAYLREPKLLLASLRYAGVFYGGLIVGLLFVVWYCRRHELPFGKVADVFAPAVALAHAFGRLGCFLAGCCFGKECALPWAVTFHNEIAHETVGTPTGHPLHPVQLYEAGGNLLIFLALLWLFPRKRFDGQVVVVYMILYAATRFLWEFFRDDARGFLGPLSTSQWLALAVGIASLAFLARRTLRRGEPPAGTS
jgi:phosphatidylglycerol:prolipoprotein diacylglycerol transferase